jgi:hypothetical protein
MRVRSSARSGTALALGTALLLAGCSREAPEVREVRRAAEDYFRALKDRDVKEIADRSTCLVSANSLVGARVLSIEPPRRVREGTIDSLARVSVSVQRAADSTWAYAKDATADSLFRIARTVSVRASVYRNAERAMILSSPGRAAASDSTLESRIVRARFRYSGPVIGPKPVDREQIVRLLRVPGGKWIVFSVYVREADPAPEPL